MSQSISIDQAKLVCVGDGGIGKTCLLTVAAGRPFPTGYVPTVFENHSVQVNYKHRSVDFQLWDTAGQEDYDRLRPLSYPDSDVILICFAIDAPASIENVLDKWAAEIAHFCEGVPVILVGNKTDTRTQERALQLLAAQGAKPISREHGAAVARKIGASYMEVSTLRNEGVKEVFALALELAMKRTKREEPQRKQRCRIL